MKIIRRETIELIEEELKLIEACNDLICLIHTQSGCSEIDNICARITDGINELWDYIE